MNPPDTTHIENDGTYWREINDQWWHWSAYRWWPYVGAKTQSFYNKFRAV